MGTVDVYRITNELDSATLDVLTIRLEARGKHVRFRQMTSDYLDAMEIDSAATVLDLGCGTGVASRAIARRPGFSGRVTGIDRSPQLVAAAIGLPLETALRTRSISWRETPIASSCATQPSMPWWHTRSSAIWKIPAVC